MKKPDYYATPLKKRDQIIAWLTQPGLWSCRGGPYYSHRTWHFCFNVKPRDVDLSFGHLLQKLGESGDGRAEDAYWVGLARERFMGVGADDLMNLAIEDAQRRFTGRMGEHYNKPDDDGYSMLWGGAPVETEFAFFGRNSGWLTLTHFNGVELTTDDDFSEWEYAELRKLYQFIVMLAHDTKKPEVEVEHQAAFHFFQNICGDIPVAEDEFHGKDI